MTDLGFEIAARLAEVIGDGSDGVRRGGIGDESLVRALERSLWPDLARTGPLWSNIRLVHEGRDLHPRKYMRARIGDGLIAHSQLDTERADRYLQDGGTLVHDHIHESSRTVQRIQESLEYLLGARVWVQAYLTRTGESAFGTHVDDHNFIALQVCGNKAWTVHDERSGAKVLDEVLASGDCVYAAADSPHAVTGLGTLSLHLTIAFDWLTAGRRGSALSLEERDRHAAVKRIGSPFPVTLRTEADLSELRFRLSARTPPEIEECDGALRVRIGTTTVRLDRRLAPVVTLLASGRECDLAELCASTGELDRDRIRRFLLFGAHSGLIYC